MTQFADWMQLKMDVALDAHRLGKQHWTVCQHFAEYERLWRIKYRAPRPGWDANGSPVEDET